MCLTYDLDEKNENKIKQGKNATFFIEDSSTWIYKRLQMDIRDKEVCMCTLAKVVAMKKKRKK